jgi:periplasmic protein CpxP/Spy
MIHRLSSRVAMFLLLAACLPVGPAARAGGEPATLSAVDQAQTPRGKQIATSVERHIAELHKRLKIGAAQQPQWDAFAQVMRENAMHSDKLYKARADAENMNALEDLRSYASIAQAHADDVQRLVPAFEALYSTLTPEQQRAADQAFKEFEQRGKHPAGRG